jgi:hypothetical protein
MVKRAISFAAVTLAAMLMASSGNAGPLTHWDQRSDSVAGFYTVISNSVVQPFTPTLSAVDAVELCFDSESGGEIAVQIVDAGGNVLGTSKPVTITASPAPWPASLLPFVVGTFTFDSPVGLTPGAEYSISGVNLSGHAYAARTLDPTDPTGDGASFWFREGVRTEDPTQTSVAVPAC